jgi:hypothetical protein
MVDRSELVALMRYEFENAKQGNSSRINRLLLKNGTVIELEIGSLAREYPTRALPS